MKFAFRQLLKNPGFTAVAVMTLALGIGANTVVFSVARTVLLRPLGFDGEDRLMWIRLENTQTGANENQLSWQDMEDIRSSAHPRKASNWWQRSADRARPGRTVIAATRSRHCE